MAVKEIKVNGRWVWQARVAYKGLRKSTIRERKDQARTAESELLQELKAKAGQAAQQAEAPATLRSLFDAYVENLEARGKGAETIGRAAETARAFERLMPHLIDQPVTKIREADIFAFRKAREATSLSALALRERAEALRLAGKTARAGAFERKAVDRQSKGTKPGTINRDLRTLRATLKRAVPDFRFPSGAFFQDDETRVRWLRPEEELLVLETMRSPFREIAKLAALTLMRLSEIRLLRRECVHLEQGVVMCQGQSGRTPGHCQAPTPKRYSGASSRRARRANGCSRAPTGAPTTVPTLAGCSGALRSRLGFATFTSTTSGITGRRSRLVPHRTPPLPRRASERTKPRRGTPRSSARTPSSRSSS